MTLRPFFVITWFACVFTQAPGTDGQSTQALTGHNFVYTLKREEFYGQQIAANEPIALSPSLSGLPDLPSWMKFVQANESQDGYLYGTPVQVTEENLQVVALNKNTYQSEVNNMTVVVQQSTVVAKYRVQLHIKNLNIEDMFVDNHLQRIRDAIFNQWPEGGAVFVTRVATFQDIGRRIPIPSYIGEVVKNGVFVEVGGTSDFSVNIKSVPIEINIDSCRDGGDGKPPVTMDTLFSPTFMVDWCSFKLVTVNEDGTPPSTEDAHKPINLDEGSVFQPTPDPPARLDLFIDFIIIVVVPAAVMVLLVLVLSCVFFGFRTNRSSRNNQTSDLQLQQYSSVRYAADRLRGMSQRREEAPATVFNSPVRPSASGFEPSEASTPGSIRERSRVPDSIPPPPYRLPPSYPTNASFRSEDSLQDHQTSDDQYLVPERSRKY